MPLYKLPPRDRREGLMLLPYGASQSWLRAPELLLPPEDAARELLAFEDLITQQPNTAVRRALLQRARKWDAKQVDKARPRGQQRPGRPASKQGRAGGGERGAEGRWGDGVDSER
eukprot:scaffold32910_cov86-Isochrysis_galbana.AAC.4